jgi:hypothetical protein
MGVLGTTIDFEFFDHGVAKWALRQHTFDGFFKRAARMLGLHVTEIDRRNTAWVAGVAVVNLV